MLEHFIEIRVRYSETDRMGYVYYGNYAPYFETGRVEWLRNLGISYKDMEDTGVLLPVLEYTIKFLRPALYDELLTLKTELVEIPTAKIKFRYSVYNENKKLITTANTTLVFLSKKNNKPMRCPDYILSKIPTINSPS